MRLLKKSLELCSRDKKLHCNSLDPKISAGNDGVTLKVPLKNPIVDGFFNTLIILKALNFSKTKAVKAVAKLRDLQREVAYQITTEIKWEPSVNSESMDSDECLD